MALLAEDGTIVVGANTYAGMDYANAYHLSLNNTSWDEAEDEPKEAGLIYATRYIEGAPVLWKGEKLSTVDDTLLWPRWNAYDGEVALLGVPERLKRAVCELALGHLTSALNKALARGGDLSSVWVGPITVSWNDWASTETQYPMVKRLLKGLYIGGGSQRRIVRG